MCHFHAAHAPSSVVRLPVMAQTRDYGAAPADEVSLSLGSSPLAPVHPTRSTVAMAEQHPRHVEREV